jgi:hypothetical protein
MTAMGPTAVKSGDIVVVNPGGSAQITYPDGCTVPVAIGTIVTIGAQSPCTTQGSMTPTQASIPPPQDNAPPTEGDDPASGDEAPDTTGIGDLAITVAVAGAAVGGILLTQKDKPASP